METIFTEEQEKKVAARLRNLAHKRNVVDMFATLILEEAEAESKLWDTVYECIPDFKEKYPNTSICLTDEGKVELCK